MLGRLRTTIWIAGVTAISRAKKWLMGPHVAALLVDSATGPLLVDVEDQVVGRRLSYRGNYAPEELARLIAVIDKKSTVLVVGTHIGTHAIAIARCCAAVTAIEANPKIFKLLRFNLLLNDCSNVEAINIAASDKPEQIKFVMNKANSGGSKRAPAVRDYVYFYDSPEVVSLTAAPLDAVLAGKTFDVVLMDIEGSEYFALKGMPSILSSCRELFVEFIPHHLRNVSCVTVPQFVSTIDPYFSKLFIPSKKLRVDKEDFVPALQAMYERGECDDGLQFSK